MKATQPSGRWGRRQKFAIPINEEADCFVFAENETAAKMRAKQWEVPVDSIQCLEPVEVQKCI